MEPNTPQQDPGLKAALPAIERSLLEAEGVPTTIDNACRQMMSLTDVVTALFCGIVEMRSELELRIQQLTDVAVTKEDEPRKAEAIAAWRACLDEYDAAIDMLGPPPACGSACSTGGALMLTPKNAPTTPSDFAIRLVHFNTGWRYWAFHSATGEDVERGLSADGYDCLKAAMRAVKRVCGAR